MSLLTDVRADTDEILVDWGETINVQRATRTPVSGAGGETTSAWTTNLTVSADVQALHGPQSRRATITLGGYDVPVEKIVYFPHGSDVKTGDRFYFDLKYHYFGKVLLEEDKVQGLAANYPKDGG